MSIIDGENNQETSAANALRELCQFDGGAGEFWTRYLQAVASFCGARAAALYVRPDAKSPDPANPADAPEWRVAAGFPANRTLNSWSALTASLTAIQKIGSEVVLLGPLASADMEGMESALCGICARLALPGADAVVAIEIESGSEQEAGVRLLTALAVAELAEWRRTGDAARKDAARFGSVLDLLIQLAAQDRFYSACMLLCNELCGRLGCDRVSLGWVNSDRVRLRAVSHTEKIDVKMEVARRLEAAMDEALDQGEDVVVPRTEDRTTITRDHEVLAKASDAEAVASFPLGKPDKVGGDSPDSPEFVAVLTLERSKPAFSPAELGMVRLLAGQAGPPLSALHARDRWMGARVASWGRKRLAAFLGTGHTWWKALGILLTLLVLVLVFVHKEHKVKGSFAIRTDSMAQLTAPFPGHLSQVDVRVGDEVAEGQPLFALDDRELRLQRQAAVAERERHETDAMRAESTGDLATMRVSLARQHQAEAQLQLADFQLQRAVTVSPVSGVVVEGDLRERIAAPVEKGETLMKVARIEGMYLMVDVPERDIELVTEGARGQAVFASQPDRKFAFTVEIIQPVAMQGEDGNVFPVRCVFDENPEEWWRPGMTGIAGVHAGKRSLLWIATYRTMDAMRMRFW